MAGHSKWSKVKRQKGIKDQQKSSVFAKLSRAISLGVREGGGITDPVHNIRLRFAIEKAKEFNMPKETIERAIEKGSGVGVAELKEVLYEALGPYGSMFVIVGMTDNTNRTSSEIRNTLERRAGKMGTVLYGFNYTGLIGFDLQKYTEEEIMEFAEKIESTDFVEEKGELYLFFPPSKLAQISTELGELTPSLSPELIYRPLSSITLSDVQKEEIEVLIEALEELSDVQTVFSNVE